MEKRKNPISSDRTIYVGCHGSSCCNSDGKRMEEFLAVLTDCQGRELVLKMKQCPICGKVYLRGDKYKKLWYRLKNYSFISTKTGKPPCESYIGTVRPSNRQSKPIDWDEVYPTPAYIVQALRHPYQGGRCSGK